MYYCLFKVEKYIAYFTCIVCNKILVIIMSSKNVTFMIIGKRDQNCKLIQNHVKVNWGTIIERIKEYDSREFTKLSGNISYFQKYTEFFCIESLSI